MVRQTTARQGALENQGKSLGVRESTPGLGQCLREKENYAKSGPALALLSPPGEHLNRASWGREVPWLDDWQAHLDFLRGGSKSV